MSGAQGEAAVEQTDVGSYFVANLRVKSDKVWKLMESLYPPEMQRLKTWREGTRPEEAAHKANELVLPEGRRT